MAAAMADAYRDIGDPAAQPDPGALNAGVRHIASFASFVTEHLFGPSRRPAHSAPAPAPAPLDIAALEPERPRPRPADRPHDRLRDSPDPVSFLFRRPPAPPRSLKSPRRLLQRMVPNVASHLLAMDLALLAESPARSDITRHAWKGCSAMNRAQVWRILLAYEPLAFAHRRPVLQRKRAEYRRFLAALHAPRGPVTHPAPHPRLDPTPSLDTERSSPTCTRLARSPSGASRPSSDWSAQHADHPDAVEYTSFSAKTLRQIEMDLPRTHPALPIFHVDSVRNPMRRILYVFGMLNPNKNYVQGMNELLTPILVVFLSHYLTRPKDRGILSFLRRSDLHGALTHEQMADAEADAFWTFTNLVSCVEDNFVSDQPGILRRVARLEQIVRAVDPPLAAHLAKNGNEFIQFAFRWMNCLLMRELPFDLVVRLWDALLGEHDGIADLHVYFCAAIMTRFSAELMSMDFEDCIMFLQHLPTNGWDVDDIDELLCQAHIWKDTLQLASLACSESRQV